MLSRFLPVLRRTVIAAMFTAIGITTPLGAQTATATAVANRITTPTDDSSRVTLQHTVHSLVKAVADDGAVSDDVPLDRLQIVLKRSDSQEASLKQLISDLHTPGSASYHKWLTPDQFGIRFGPSDQDIAAIETWLQSKGFSVTKVNPGKQTLEFSGNAGQFRNAFHAQIHKYVVNGETHYSNSTDPQIPTALAPVFGGFTSLNTFRGKRNVKVLGKANYDSRTDKATPEWTTGGSSSAINESFVLSPGDVAVQYDLNPLYSAGTNGSGQTIAVINDSNINVSLVNSYRTLFGLSTNPPQVIIDGNDPGIDGINNPDGPNYDSVEAYLDVEEAGAVAPNATIDLVIAADTALQYGLLLAAEHAVYGNIAPVISFSFGACEVDSTLNQTFGLLWEQAAAQGITVLVSSGDSGSADCDSGTEYAVNGQAVNGWGSSPYNISVGGTDFYYSAWNSGSTAIDTQLATYWNTASSNSTPAVSIKGVIPEQPWNDSQYGLGILSYYTNFTNSTATSISGGGGGASNCATYDTNGNCLGYPKPSWQTGTGVPADTVRDLPDLSLLAADGLNDSYYPICYQDGDCQPASSGNLVQITGIGGTSVSTSAFAGIMALVNQTYGPQGQADFVLYPLATQFPASFHDVVNGTNSVPCGFSLGALDCIAVTDPITVTDPTYGNATEGQIGSGTTAQYNAGSGYDLASGLGSVDANLLITNWGSVKFASTTTTLTPSSSSFTHGTSITVSGTVTPSSGTPTGDVALMTDSAEPLQQGQTFFTLSSGSYTGNVSSLPGGTYNIWGQYGGDATNAPSTSQKTQITVSPEASGIDFNIYSPSGTVLSGTTGVDYGMQLVLSAQVAPSSQLTAFENCLNGANGTCPVFGVPTGTVAFSDSATTINSAVLNAQGDAEYNAPFSVGSHSVAASYAGDNSYSASTAAATSFTVVKDTPVLLLSTATSTGQYTSGQPTVFNIQVENGATASSAVPSYGLLFPSTVAPPTGTVTITGLPAGSPTTGTLNAGVDTSTRAVEGTATITLPATVAAGTYNVTFSYSGDANYNAASGAGQVIITSGSLETSATTATATGSISPTTSIAVTGTVTGQPASAAPTGSILVFASGYQIAAVGIIPGTGDSSTFTLTLNSQNLPLGTNFVTLQYSGDTVYSPSSFTLSTAINNPLSDFSMVPQSSVVNVPAASGTATDIVNISSVNGFAGAVSLTCSATGGVQCSLSPIAPSLTSGGSAAVTLTITNANVATAGSNYNVVITGVDPTGKFIHTLGIRVIATAAPGPAAIALTTGANSVTLAHPGSSATVPLFVTPSGGFSGNVSFSCTIPGTGLNCSAPTVPVALSTAEASAQLSITSTTATAAGNYTATITASDTATGKITSTAILAVTVGQATSFTLSTAPGTLSIVAGTSTGDTSTISVMPLNGFTGDVALTCAVTAPIGATSPATCALASPSVSITGATAVTSMLTVATTATTTLGSYSVTVTGTGTGSSGGITETATVTATVTAAPSFALSSNPASLNFAAEATTGNSSVISVTPSNGFTGNVSLTCAVSGPSGAANPATCTLTPATVDVTSTAALTSTLAVVTNSTTTNGAYTITVTGSGDDITQTATVTAMVTAAPTPSFTLTGPSNPITVSSPGESGTGSITVTPAGEFNGTVSFSCAVASGPAGSTAPTCSGSANVTSGVTTGTLTVSTTPLTTGALQTPSGKLFSVVGGIAFAGLLFFGIPARRRNWRMLLGVVLFAVIAAMNIGCGGGHSGGGGSTTTGTLTGSYTLTVTGTSGAETATTTVNLTVN